MVSIGPSWLRAVSGTAQVRAAEALGLATIREAYADRAYTNTGLLYAVRQLDGTPYFNSLQEVADCDDRIKNLLNAEMRLVNDLDPLASSGPSSTVTAQAAGS